MKKIDIKTTIPYDKLTKSQRALVVLCGHNGLRYAVDFDEIDEVLAQVVDFDFCYIDKEQSPTTPLHAACDNDNINLVAKLLEHGATADILVFDSQNSLKNGTTPLWELQYPLSIADESQNEERNVEANIRLKIAELLLDYGANPMETISGTESLFEYVNYKYYYEKDESDYWYIEKFYEQLQKYAKKYNDI